MRPAANGVELDLPEFRVKHMRFCLVGRQSMYRVDYTDPFFPCVRESSDGYLTYWQAAEVAVAALRAHIETAAHAIESIMEGP